METLKISKTVLTDLIPMSVEDMLKDSMRDYNPQEYEKSINRFCKYEEIQFYKKPSGQGYGYDRFFVTYVADGIRFFSSFNAYSSSITSNGFCKISILSNFNVLRTLFTDSYGKVGRISNDERNRNYLRMLTTTNKSVYFSNEF